MKACTLLSCQKLCTYVWTYSTIYSCVCLCVCVCVCVCLCVCVCVCVCVNKANYFHISMYRVIYSYKYKKQIKRI